jgi:competence ComEA-like helix-hairpin-helix protein
MPTWRDGPWTLPQRRVVLVIATGLLAILVYRAFTRPTSIPAPLPADGPRAAELVSQIDPNVATWQEISLLPGLGEKRAKAVVAYRDQFKIDHPGQVAFRRAEDLMNISGIGEATVANLAPYLTFSSEPGH